MPNSLSSESAMQQAIQVVLAKFKNLGVSKEILLTTADTQMQKKCDEIAKEMDEEMLLVTQIKSQNKEQKAQQSYEQNMKGMEETFTSGFGTSSIGFYPGTSNYNTSQEGASDKLDRESQIKFQEIMRETTMSFFKTTKSTQLNSDNQSRQHRTTTNFFQAWGEAHQYEAAPTNHPVKTQNIDNNSDLGAQTEHVLAGGSLSILRRKGKAYKVVGKAKVDQQHFAPTEQTNNKMLSSDILSLVKEFREEAKTFKPVSHALYLKLFHNRLFRK